MLSFQELSLYGIWRTLRFHDWRIGAQSKQCVLSMVWLEMAWFHSTLTLYRFILWTFIGSNWSRIFADGGNSSWLCYTHAKSWRNLSLLLFWDATPTFHFTFKTFSYATLLKLIRKEYEFLIYQWQVGSLSICFGQHYWHPRNRVDACFGLSYHHAPLSVDEYVHWYSLSRCLRFLACVKLLLSLSPSRLFMVFFWRNIYRKYQGGLRLGRNNGQSPFEMTRLTQKIEIGEL